MKLPLKIFDVLVILLALGITVFSFFIAYVKPSNTKQVLIRGQDSEWIFQSGSDETVSVTGPAGVTVVKIHNNHAWVESSDCDNQTCVAQGALTKQGQWAACLPNSVLVIIQGADENDNEIHAVSR